MQTRKIRNKTILLWHFTTRNRLAERILQGVKRKTLAFSDVDDAEQAHREQDR